MIIKIPGHAGYFFILTFLAKAELLISGLLMLWNFSIKKHIENNLL